ncbi:MAG: ATP-binding protein [Spirochaetales bacterium]|nr:ATP-binding protein [Spirochaetales bacterium]
MTLKNKIRFNWRKGAGGRQLAWKSGLPGLTLLIMVSLIIYISSSQVQRSLTRQYYSSSSKAVFQAIDQIYDPILLTFKISSLWVQIGQIDTLGDPVSYGDNLKSIIMSDTLAQSMTIRDSQGTEIDVYTQEDGTPALQKRQQGAAGTLNVMRNGNNISFSTAEGIIETALRIQHSPIKMSQAYSIPVSGDNGITIYYRLYKDSEQYIEVWMDISLRQLATAVSEYSINENTVIFIILNDEEFVTYPIKDVISFSLDPDRQNRQQPQNPMDIEVIQSIYRILEEEDQGTTGIHEISLESGSWWTQYSSIDLVNSSVVIGSYTPESELLISRLQSPLILVLIFFSLAIGFYFILLFNDYRRVLQKQLVITEEERIKQMIILGENLYCEFKSSMRWDYKEEAPSKVLEQVIMKSISAFSNSDGGILLIGVADDGEILGLEKDYSCLKEEGKDYFELHLRTLLSNMFGVAYPVSNIKVDFPVVNGKEICRVNIKPGDQPLYIVSNEKGSGKSEKFYVRSGNSSRQICSLREITDYVMNRFR